MADAVVLRRAGELILSNLVWALPPPSDEFRTGHVHIDAADQAVKTQTAAVYELLQQALGAAHPAHQRVHLRDQRDHAGWAQVVRERFPDWLPATTVFGEGDGLPAGAELAVEVIATEHPPERVGPADPFPAAVRAGGWIFTSAVAPEQRGDIAAQTASVWRRLLALVEEAGGDRTTLLKQNGYTRFHLKEFTTVDAARRRFFDRVDDVPPATTVQVADLGHDLQFEVIAAVKGAGRREPYAAGETFAFYTPVVRYRDVVFTSGELAWEPGAWENDEGRRLVPQARAVLDRLRELLAVAGADAKDLARANFYVRDRRFSETLHRLTEESFGNPAFVDTTVVDCGPYEVCLFELDAISAARPR